MLSRRGFLAMATAVPRPSIVFVLVDQWRAQALGYRGGDRNAHTPAIDAARSGRER